MVAWIGCAATYQSTLLVTGPQKPAALCRRYNSGDSKVMSAGAMPCKRAAAAPSYSESGGASEPSGSGHRIEQDS